MTSDEMQQTDIAKVAKGQAVLDKFYRVIKNNAKNMDDLIAAVAVVPTLLAYMIIKIHPGDRAARLEQPTQ